MQQNQNVDQQSCSENESGTIETPNSYGRNEWTITTGPRGIIYKTTNSTNGKSYIGKDANNNPSYLGSGKLLKLAIAKYGIQNFSKSVLEECDTIERLNEREVFWIDYYKTTDRKFGYNIASGGLGGDTFSNQPDDVKKIIREKLSKASIRTAKTSKAYKSRGPKISKAKRGMKFSDEHKLALSLSHVGKSPSNKGKKCPEMSKARMGSKNPMFGKTISDEQKNVIREANKLRWKRWKERREIQS